MFETGQNWQLFGYDMRRPGTYWTAAWRDFLWGYDSPVRRHLDEVVTLQDGTDTAFFQAGKACQGPSTSGCSAILLPEDRVLAKKLTVPVSAESELASVLTLEVKASSPFAPDDTGWGWTVLARDEAQLQVALVIVSMSATMAYLGRQYDVHDVRAREVWVAVDDSMVVVQGFAEQQRETRYGSRLLRAAAMLGIIAALLLAIIGVAAALKGAELQRLETMAAQTNREAAEASRLKSLLALTNDTIAAANEVVLKYPNPHVEIARLTQLLGDDASISNFSMAGPAIRLRGRAVDAASIMQQLTDQAEYLEVTAPQAIARLGDTGFEQFYLNIRLGDIAAGGETQ